MIVRGTLRPLPVAVLLGCLLWGGALGADWIVTVEGERLETRGPWQVDGELIVFTAADGTLSSIPADDVDLEASRRASSEDEAPSAAEPEPERPRARIVITDADVRRAPAAAPDSSAELAEESTPSVEGSASTPGATDGRPPSVEVSEWEEGEGPEGLGAVIRGVARNVSDATATGIQVTVVLLDSEGEERARQRARVARRALPPGQESEFQASFPEVSSYSDLRFEVESLDFVTASPAAADDDEEEAETGSN